MLVKPDSNTMANIKVVGIGGGGGNAINTMINDYQIDGVDFIAINTDTQALKNSAAPTKVHIGPELTRGLGAGGDPEMGEKAAEESIDALHDVLAGADMVFITTGMGGGTGTGAAPVVGGIARNMGALTVGVVTKPFGFEMKKRMDLAVEGISKLKDNVDTMIVVPNQRVLEITDKNYSFVEAMKKVDEVLANAVQSISGLVTQTGFINLDFADVRVVMKDAGTAMMGMGGSSGESRAEQAARQAINSPLLEMSIEGATGVLFNIRGGSNMTMHEVDTAATLISEMLDPNAIVKFGATVHEDLGDEIHITVLAAGFDMNQALHGASGGQAAAQSSTVQQQSATTSGGQPVAGSGTPAATGQTTQGDDSQSKSSYDQDNDDELDIPAFLRKN